MTRDALHVLLSGELSRMRREAVSLGLFAFARREPGMQVYERSAIAQLGERRFAALFTRDAGSFGAFLEFVESTARADDFDGGGLVSIEGGPDSLCDARSVLRAGETLLEEGLRARRLERILVRRDAVALRVAPG